MRLQKARRVVPAVLMVAGFATALRAADSTDAAVLLGNDFTVEANITYQVANGYENKLDVYRPRNATKATPTVVYIHGGGWTGGTKEAVSLRVLPYLQLGMAVVNVEYRLAKISLAPAAVADCRCALRWVIDHAAEYKFDPTRLVVTGGSAGGHLALTTGMLDPAAGLDNECAANTDKPALKVAAIVNFYGITDVADLLSGPNRKTYAVQWLGSLPNAVEVAKRVSPLTYVRKDLPPILTIHGDADPTVPYQHGVRLHEALDKAGVPNELMTIPGGKHGGFTNEEMLKIQKTIETFLTKYGVLGGTT